MGYPVAFPIKKKKKLRILYFNFLVLKFLFTRKYILKCNVYPLYYFFNILDEMN